ncbi:MAG: tRNA uridine-5-carboxymethylaminomethyl(34) synthesis GTPase MnmE [Clostridiales bacterium]|jgi:tRNA modification GTPase|nr:tRNA uridine-5-carboxymethylaminomethyl(34) synthesis GTPase MnmE [Clostridiales bacterium]
MINETTIAAVATPQAAGGIGIVRISGKDAFPVAQKVFYSKKQLLFSQSEGYKAHYGWVYDNETAVDEAIFLVFKAPHSYTGEDVVEISCHGGLFIVKRVLQAVLNAGAVPAQPGEFTKRAFLNGRLDLSKAEAVMSIIGAQGERAAQAALNTLEGALSREINDVAQLLINESAHIAAWVDYPDEEIEDISTENLTATVISAKEKLTVLLDRFDGGRAVMNGVDAVIVGRPNVGKSTLMNLLSGYERSIVTSFEGTTRDVVEETVTLGDVVLHLSDTAGMRETENPVESIGVRLARKRLERAELVLAVFDGSEAMTNEDRELLRRCRGKKTLAIINKSDLIRRIDFDFIKENSDRLVEISATTGNGYEQLKNLVFDMLGARDFNPGLALLTNERQRNCCVRAVKWLNEALDALKNGVTLDAVNICIDSAVEALLELTGKKVSEAVVDEVFAMFCVGK